MKRAAAIIVGVAMVCLVAYLSWLNPTAADFRFSANGTVNAPLGALMVFAFVTGALLVLAAVMIQAGRRAFITWRAGRQQRRLDRIEDWEARGEALIWKGDTQQGRTLLQKAWQRGPESAHAVLALARSYRDTGEPARARQLLTTAATRHHTNPDLLFALAEAHGDAGDGTASTEVLERVRALHPHAPRVLRALHDRYVEAKRWADAAAVQEALLGELRDPRAVAREREHLLALRYQAALSLPDAPARVRALEALADSRAGSVPVWVSLGDALVASGRDAEASVMWERALRSAPRTVLVERLAQLASEERHRDRLRTLLRKLRTDQVDAKNVHLLTAQLHLADGSLDESVRELEAVQSPGPAPRFLHRLWADVHRRRGHLDQAFSAYTQGDDVLPAYHCRVCQQRSQAWVGFCPHCGEWDSYRSDVEIGA